MVWFLATSSKQPTSTIEALGAEACFWPEFRLRNWYHSLTQFFSVSQSLGFEVCCQRVSHASPDPLVNPKHRFVFSGIGLRLCAQSILMSESYTMFFQPIWFFRGCYTGGVCCFQIFGAFSLQSCGRLASRADLRSWLCVRPFNRLQVRLMS